MSSRRQTEWKCAKHKIYKLLKSGAAIECTDILPYVINPLTMSVNHKGKESLILDLRHVNQYIEKRKHKFERCRTVIS
jgi:hypothetical protein